MKGEIIKLSNNSNYQVIDTKVIDNKTYMLLAKLDASGKFAGTHSFYYKSMTEKNHIYGVTDKDEIKMLEEAFKEYLK